MLQKSKQLYAIAQESGQGAESSPAELIETVLSFLRRRHTGIIVITLLAFALASAYVYVTPPSFTAQANILIDTRKLQVLKQAPILGDMNLDSVTIESQIELIKSDNIALAVIKKLRLTDDPEFLGANGGLTGSLFKIFLGSSLQKSAPESESELTETVLRAFQNRLSAFRLGLSSVIAIQFQSNTPDRAAQIANALGEAYIVDQLDARTQASKTAGEWLETRIAKLRGESVAAERAVIDFKAKNNIVAAEGLPIDERQIASLNTQLLTARAQLSEARARLDRIEAIIRADVPGSASMATVSDTLNNPIIIQLRTKYLEYVNREADWAARYGRNHLAVVHLRRQIADIRASILDELRRIAETYKSEYEIAQQRQATLEKFLGEAVEQSRTTNKARTTLHDLESHAQQYRGLYDTFLQRYMESVQQQSLPLTEARLILKATKAETKKKPKISRIFAIAVGAGFGLGVGLGLLRDLVDHVFRTERQVEEHLQTDCIAILPALSCPKSNMLSLRRISPNSSSREIILPDTHANLMGTVIESPFSRYTEAIRAIKMSVDSSGGANSGKVVGFTSSLPNEGKSTIAASFAFLTANVGARVILVDCDLRTASLSRILAPNAEHGIEDIIAGRVRLEEVIWKEPLTQLSFLPAAVRSRAPNANEILGSEAMNELFDRLRERYEYIVVDLSPLIPIIDVKATGQFVDFYTFVIEWGRTKIGVVEHALAGARTVYENIHGVVLNKVDTKHLARYEHSAEKYYRQEI